jgi:menaquinone-dependent protoporphyrinogen oxidase
MKPIAVLYATREGHTRRIAERVAARVRSRGFDVAVRNLAVETDLDFARYSAAILAASVHVGAHEREMVKFVKRNLSGLQSLPTAFISASLSQAGVERATATPEEHARFVADVQGMLDRFYKDVMWHPTRVKAVAGALLYRQYNFFIRFIMKQISRKAGGATDTSRDYDYTDWAALDGFIDEFCDSIKAPSMAYVQYAPGR